MQQNTTELRADPAGIAAAADLLGAGALVAFPTETVYGLGADARNSTAVAGIFAAKNRPQFNPLIIHLAEVEQAKALVHWTDTAAALAQAFWPGPLTLVLRLRENHGLSPLVTAGLDTVGLRIPANDTAHRLLTRFGGPVAAPSANPSGRISPTTAAHVQAGLSGKIAAVLNGGACAVGLESTIISAFGTPTLLRAGGVGIEDIEASLGESLAQPETRAITAPGQLASHYAPGATVRLNATKARPGEVLLGFGAIAGTLNLSASGDLTEAAANLFGHLHLLDQTGQPIAVAPVPQTGLGLAINDRLNRAAAPR